MKKKFINLIKNPLLLFVFLNNKKILNLSDETYLKIRYYVTFHKKLNLDEPKTYNEKLQWLKLNDRKDEYSNLVDKYEVKKFVADIIGNEYIIKTLGVYDNFDSINFEELPNRFVIKCTHDSGGLVIVKNKSNLDIKATRKKINKCLKSNYYHFGREWPYKNVKPRIIIEEYIEDKNGVLNDFKLQTFNGKVAFSFVCTDRATGNVKFTFFDNNKHFIPVTQCGELNDPINAKLPINYEKFVELAEKLAKDTIELRVDFYDVDGKIYFGELTFFDTSGFGPFDPEEWDLKFGEMLKLPK